VVNLNLFGLKIDHFENMTDLVTDEGHACSAHLDVQSCTVQGL
jgi:hypothetical protein